MGKKFGSRSHVFILNNEESMQKHEVATFGAGCFWGVEEAFRTVPGVVETSVGFMGGSLPNPSYEEVCHKNTGHAEVVHIVFDPEKVSYDDLLAKFWEIHDPTQRNRQGPDIGDQYRSVIFFHSSEQKIKAENSKLKRDASGQFPKPIVTAIEKAHEFYPAEEYHQKYFLKNGGGVCHV